MKWKEGSLCGGANYDPSYLGGSRISLQSQFGQKVSKNHLNKQVGHDDAQLIPSFVEG
jgi:hypothetical protein